MRMYGNVNMMEPADARVMLLSNTHLALSDDQIAKKLREQLIDEKVVN